METIKMHVNESLVVNIIPNASHSFLMSTRDVAIGYGINANTLRGHKSLHRDELIENKHYMDGVCFSNGNDATRKTTMWTKNGIIRLGFYIKSERAKLFRDWIEKLIIEHIEKKLPNLPEARKVKHNRLTPERLLSIMNDVCRIEDGELRTRIAAKLMGEF